MYISWNVSITTEELITTFNERIFWIFSDRNYSEANSELIFGASVKLWIFFFYRQLYEARRKANGERVRPNPMYRCEGDLDQQNQSEDDSETETDRELLVEGNKSIDIQNT